MTRQKQSIRPLKTKNAKKVPKRARKVRPKRCVPNVRDCVVDKYIK